MTDLATTPDVSAERVRRMALCLQDEAPTDAEVRAARHRFLVRRDRRAPSPLKGYLACVAAGAAGALLLVHVFNLWRPGGDAPVSVAPEVIQTTTSVRPGVVAQAGVAYFERNGVRESARDGLRITLAQGESGAVVVGDSRTELSGPAVIEFQKRAGTSSGWRVRVNRAEDEGSAQHAPKRRARAPAGERTEPAPAGSTDSRSWEQVAHALREEDPTAAERALRRLATRPEPQTREAAELALAQLQVAQGRDQEARATLQLLAKDASAEIVRKRAADLLKKMQ